MATLTLSIPIELKKRMENMQEVNWSEYLKKRLEVKVKQLKKFEQLAKRGDI